MNVNRFLCQIVLLLTLIGCQPTDLPATPVIAPPITMTTTPETVTSTAAEGRVTVGTLTLPTYPFADYLVEEIDPVYNLPVAYLDRPAYEAANPTPQPVEYETVTLENEYLRLTFLPELGGRLYSAVVKATGQEVFYHNRVVKPSVYGPLAQIEGVNPNWWLATGGMEWAYPVQEHGHRWGVAWTYSLNQTAEATTITLSDVGEGRVGAQVEVTLPVDSGHFTVEATLINNTSQAVPVQFWSNAALSLSEGGISPRNQFILPVEEVIVHSRGADGWDIPDARQRLTWPIHKRFDLQTYNEWQNYLGVFIPDMAAPFVGAYNPETDLGIARLIEPTTVPGTKLFAFGQNFPDRSYTDDGSQYFELWGGINRGFWAEDDVSVPAGERVAWREAWWPLAQLGGLTWANHAVALHLNQTESSLDVATLFSQPTTGRLVITAAGTVLLDTPFAAQPSQPQRWQLSATDAPVRIQLLEASGTLLLDYP